MFFAGVGRKSRVGGGGVCLVCGVEKAESDWRVGGREGYVVDGDFWESGRGWWHGGGGRGAGLGPGKKV